MSYQAGKDDVEYGLYKQYVQIGKSIFVTNDENDIGVTYATIVKRMAKIE